MDKCSRFCIAGCISLGNHARFMKQLFSTRLFFFCLLFFVLGTLPADAVIKNWINTSGGNWSDPLSWSPNGVPTAADGVTITNNGTYTVLVSTTALPRQ